MGGIDPRNLINSAQLAERLGLKHRESVIAWRRRYSDFPRPVYAEGKVMIWDWAEVRDWAIATGRLNEDGTRPGD